MRRFFELTGEQAAAVIARRMGIPPTRETSAPVTFRTKLVAALLGVGSRPQRRARLRLPVHQVYVQAFSPSSTSYGPPFFKNFLRLDVDPDGLRIRCFAATGHREQEIDPPVEDEITIPFG